MFLLKWGWRGGFTLPVCMPHPGPRPENDTPRLGITGPCRSAPHPWLGERACTAPSRSPALSMAICEADSHLLASGPCPVWVLTRPDPPSFPRPAEMGARSGCSGRRLDPLFGELRLLVLYRPFFSFQNPLAVPSSRATSEQPAGVNCRQQSPPCLQLQSPQTSCRCVLLSISSKDLWREYPEEMIKRAQTFPRHTHTETGGG